MKIPGCSVFFAIPLLLVAATTASAGYLDDIGYTALVSQLQEAGTALPDGTGVAVTQVEASTSTTSFVYLPTGSSYTGLTITDKSPSYSGTTSWHANMVGEKIYGDSAMGSGISQVGVYYVGDWLGTGFLNYGTSSAPKTETAAVVNHSWVSTTNNSYDKNILNRLDYSIETDDYVAVVGTNNDDSGTATSGDLLAGAYNVISVGVTDASHVAGSSTVNSGVGYPHLVVPTGTTSEATAVVSSAASLLIQSANTMGSSNGAKSETIKAVLLAGASREDLPSWSATSTSPLDATYGAGELDIQNSYNILLAGEQSSGSSLVASTGWDYNTIALGATTTYYFNLSGTGDVSIALNWNAIYSGNNANNLALALANLNLFCCVENIIMNKEPLPMEGVSQDSDRGFFEEIAIRAGRES